MRTATVTWITYNNYGTLLQAYALQKKIIQLGYRNVILSDQQILDALQRKQYLGLATKNSLTTQGINHPQNMWLRLMSLVSHPRRIERSLLRRTNRKLYHRPYEETQRLCELFKQTELKILDNISFESLTSLNEQFDIFIAGSDQIWSVFDHIFNPYYYLDFATKKKIAYAPSLGTERISKDTAKKVRELLSDYSAVSVREKKSAQQLAKLLSRNVEWVVDPVFLYDCNFWSKMTVYLPIMRKKYLLCYFLEDKEWYFTYARKLAKLMRLEIVLIPNEETHLASQYVMKNGIGPKEFISLIQNAEYVLTDSYHGSIFSLIFQKNFQYLLRFTSDHPISQNIRIQSLFDYLKLNDRIITEHSENIPAIEVDYKMINIKITSFRDKSISYLETNLKSI